MDLNIDNGYGENFIVGSMKLGKNNYDEQQVEINFKITLWQGGEKNSDSFKKELESLIQRYAI